MSMTKKDYGAVANAIRTAFYPEDVLDALDSMEQYDDDEIYIQGMEAIAFAMPFTNRLMPEAHGGRAGRCEKRITPSPAPPTGRGMRAGITAPNIQKYGIHYNSRPQDGQGSLCL